MCPDPVTGSTERSRRLYDWWAEHAPLYGVVARLSRPLREEAVDALGPTAARRSSTSAAVRGRTSGSCATRSAAGGQVVGLDHSRGMTDRARERARASGWGNVTAVRADATRLPVADGRADAAVATLALTAMPDAGTVVREVRRALTPDGRFAVMDATLGREDHPLAARLLGPVYRRVANWNPGSTSSRGIGRLRRRGTGRPGWTVGVKCPPPHRPAWTNGPPSGYSATGSTGPATTPRSSTERS